MLAPLLFIIFFAAVINVASTRFKDDKDIMDALVHLGKKGGAGGRGEATAPESVLETPLWGMLYADDAGVILQSPEQLKKMMGVIVVVCAMFVLTVSEARTEIPGNVFTREGDAGVHRHIQRRGSGPGVQPDERVCKLRGKLQPQCRSVHRGQPAHTQRMAQLPEVHLLYDRPSAPLELEIRMLRAGVLGIML